MALVRRRVVNPSPSVLALVNPKIKRGKTMATRRKRRSTKRRVHRARSRNPVNPVNPVRRRRRSVRRHRRYGYHARRRNPINPTHRRKRVGHRRHRRNPFGGGGEVVDFAGAGIFLGLVQPFASRLIGPYAQALGQFSGPVITAATGWGLSKALEMFGISSSRLSPERSGQLSMVEARAWAGLDQACAGSA